MSVYYSREIDVTLTNHGNIANATMYWFDDNETWPYDEWGEEVILTDVKMMSEKDIEEAIKEKLKNIIERGFDAESLYFKWFSE